MRRRGRGRGGRFVCGPRQPSWDAMTAEATTNAQPVKANNCSVLCTARIPARYVFKPDGFRMVAH